MSKPFLRSKSVVVGSLETGSKNLIWISVILAVAAVSIFTLSWTDASGKMSHDSAYYLRLASNIRNGHGLSVGPLLDGKDGEYFATWPVGYSVLIAGVSMLTQIPVVISAKVVNFLVLTALAAFLHFMVPKDAVIYLLAFLCGPILFLTSFTLPELAMMAGFVALAVLLWKYGETGRKCFLWAIGCMALFVFLMKYIGLAVVVAVWAFGLLLLRRGERGKAVRLMITGFLVLPFAGAYLVANKIYSGFATGIPRNPAVETNWILIKALLVGLAKQFNLLTWYAGNSAISILIYWAGYLLTCAFIGYVCFLVLKHRGDFRSARRHGFPVWIAFTLVGLLYLVSFVVVRWMSDLDRPGEIFNLRRMAPATVLILLALLSRSLQGSARKKVVLAWGTLAFSSIALNGFIYPMRSYTAGNPSILDHWQNIRTAYAPLKPGNVLISNNDLVQLVRPDLYWCRLYDPADLTRTLRNLCNKGHADIYTDIGDQLMDLKGVTFLPGLEKYKFSRSQNRILAKMSCTAYGSETSSNEHAGVTPAHGEEVGSY